ncbi:MAG TPA: hypothetical protein VFR36_00220 [Sphingomicrobium sp.]|nr:hypothetical protein [Sphingomicrobium sp.]
MVLLAACSQDPSNEVDRSDKQRLADQATNASTADKEDLKYYPISKYEKYPESVRSLIRQADRENDRCRGRFDDQTMYACNRRELIMAELEKMGWCWGGSDVGYLEHWLKCADDPYHMPGGHGPDSLYSDQEIREVTQSHAEQSATLPDARCAPARPSGSDWTPAFAGEQGD